MITEITGKCSYERCNEQATHIACGREYFTDTPHHNTDCYCFLHACMVAKENSPEYTVDCPNCGCAFGVN